MPIAFACSCGKQFRVGDEYAGKRTRCPACQQPVVVPQVGGNDSASPRQQAPAASAAPASFLAVTCTCGKSLRAKPELAGKRVRCPGCQSPLLMPTPTPEPEPEPQEQDVEQAAAAIYGLAGAGHAPAEDASPEPRADDDEDGYEAVDDEEEGRPADEESTPAEEDEYEAYERAGSERECAARPKPVSAERYQRIGSESSGSLQEYFYWGLLVFLIPLGLSLVIWDEDPLEVRVQRTFENAPPDVQIRLIEMSEDETSGEATINLFPGQRIEGAHLGRHTFIHWLYALASIVVFLFVAMILFPEAGNPLQLFGIGLFTGTIGVLLLLLFQYLAEATQHFNVVGGNIIVMFFFWTIKLIGFGYRAAVDQGTSFMGSLMGFTFGVGLCEEIAKALPLIWYYRRPGLISWREACTWGFASGAGFGVAEAIMYSGDFYNGIAPVGIYIVRFVSCVALHAIWTSSAALFIHRFQYLLQEEMAWHDWPPRLLFLVSIPMILHGFYDTFLKKELNGWALATALLSFAWFVWRIEVGRGLQASDYQPGKKKKKRARAEFA